jgi:hypothetical protein
MECGAPTIGDRRASGHWAPDALFDPQTMKTWPNGCTGCDRRRLPKKSRTAWPAASSQIQLEGKRAAGLNAWRRTAENLGIARNICRSRLIRGRAWRTYRLCRRNVAHRRYSIDCFLNCSPLRHRRDCSAAHGSGSGFAIVRYVMSPARAEWPFV